MTRNVVEYVDSRGRSSFGEWFAELDPQAAAKVATALYRLGQGNVSNTKSVGRGVFECRIHFGPGYRIYFGRDGGALIILLAGGTKKRQNTDIQRAKVLWAEYKRRKQHS